MKTNFKMISILIWIFLISGYDCLQYKSMNESDWSTLESNQPRNKRFYRMMIGELVPISLGKDPLKAIATCEDLNQKDKQRVMKKFFHVKKKVK